MAFSEELSFASSLPQCPAAGGVLLGGVAAPDGSILSPIHLVSPRERRHSAKVQAFMDHVATAFSAS